MKFAWLAAASAAALLAACSTAPVIAPGAGNTANDSFVLAKRTMETRVYYDHRTTFYCSAPFDAHKAIRLPKGFKAPGFGHRSERVEWEHVVPVEYFGRSFPEWREGAPECHDARGHRFRGRSCADKVNREFRLMQADLYNLYPSIGSVNALRSNYDFEELGASVKPTFGTCAMKIDGTHAEPPDYAKGRVARTYLYMDATYRRYSMSDSHRALMQAWDRQHPVTEWECRRARRIEAIQGNPNNFVKEPCRSKGLW